MTDISFEIHLVAQENGGYTVLTRSSTFGETHGVSQFDANADWVQDALTLLSMNLLQREQLEEFGRWLFQGEIEAGIHGLLATPQLEHLRTTLGAATTSATGRLILKLRLDPPELQVIPWELMYDQARHVFLATDPKICLLRTVTSSQTAKPLVCNKDLDLLLLTAHADSLSTQQEAKELLEISQGVKNWRCHHLESPNPEQLRSAIAEDAPHVLHYAGHGTFEDGSQLSIAEGIHETSLELLSAMGPNLRLAILNSCHSGDRDPLQNFGGLANRLLNRGVPAVITVSRPIEDRIANSFSRVFYKQLLTGQRPGDIYSAFTAARQHLQSEGGPTSRHFAAYALYLRGDSGQLFYPPPKEAAPQIETTAQPRTWKITGLLIVAMLMLRILGLFSAMDQWRHDLYLQHFLSPLELKQTIIVDLGDDVARWPWHRERLVNLLEKLVDQGVNTFALDVVLNDQPMEGESQVSFDAANRRLALMLTSPETVGILAVAGSLHPPEAAAHPYKMNITSQLPLPLRTVPQGFAVVASKRNDSGGTRWAPLMTETPKGSSNPFYFSLAALAASKGQAPIVESPAGSPSSGTSIKLGDIWIETDRHHRIQVPCLDDKPPWVPSKLIMETQTKLPSLVDKVVVLGRLLDPHEDRVSTLCGLKPGVAIQAGLTEQLLRGHSRRQADTMMESLLSPLVLLGIWGSALLLGRRGWLIVLPLTIILVLGEVYLESSGLWLNLPIIEALVFVVFWKFQQPRIGP